MTVALIMAGGKSERMRESGNECHKALRNVAGISMIERNLTQILAAGFRNVYVAVNDSESSLLEFVNERGHELVSRVGGEIQCLIEQHPLGTIGIAQQLAHLNKDVLVQNVDNLTTLSFKELVNSHRENNAALTVATHVEGFTVPLGEVIVEQNRIIEYREKPTHPVRISSGAYVLAARTCKWIAPNRRTDIPAIIPMLQAKGEFVFAFEHDSVWIDVNDSKTLSRAEQLIKTHENEFSCQSNLAKSA